MSGLTVLPLVEQLSSRVIRILGCNPSPYTLQGTNTYLIGQGSKRILLDSSGGSETLPQYISTLTKELERRNCALQEIIISHYHWDHTGGVQDIFKSITNGPISVSKHELVGKPEFDQETKYNYINDGHIFKTEGATLKAVYTPGHTGDHISLHLVEENAIFSGDCILGETSAEFEDLYDYMNSLNKLVEIKPDVIYPGHGPVVKDGVSRINAYIQHRNKRNQQIIDYLKESNQPRSIEEIVAAIYVGLHESLIGGAMTNVNNHLSALVKQHLVVQVGEEHWQYRPSKPESKI